MNPTLSTLKYLTTPFPKALQYKRFVFAVHVYAFIWVGKLVGFALNFGAWELLTWRLRAATGVRLWDGLTIIRDGHIISDKAKDGRRSAHYELKWEIPDNSGGESDSIGSDKPDSASSTPALATKIQVR